MANSDPSRVVRVEARGYKPAETPFQNATMGRLDFRLEEGGTIGGVVRDAEGKPVAGAEVVIAMQNNYAYFMDGKLRSSWGNRIEKTDDKGRFELAEVPEQSMVVAASAYGFATMPGGRARYKMELEPWGRIEGITRVGGRPVATQLTITTPSVKLDLYPGVFERAKEAYDAVRKVSRPGRMRFVDVVHFSGTVTSKPDGRYVVEKARPGKVTISRSVSTSAGNLAGAKSYTERVEVVVKAGKTVKLDLGGKGRAITGRVTMTNVTPAVMVVESPALKLLPAPPAGAVVGLEKAAGPALAAQMVEQWSLTEEGKEYYTGKRIVELVPAKDGAFRIDDVAPGKYWLVITLQGRNIGALGIGRMLEVREGEGAMELGLMGVR